MTAPAWELAGKPGTELETLLELGQGGMATAYLARAVGAAGFQRLVVLKRMNLDLLGSPEALDRFMAEARVAARIHHANVVGTQQVGRDAAGPFIVLDYVEGGSLEDLVLASEHQGERVPVPILLRIALDALAGLQAVHEAEDTDGHPLNILHRDVSLQNILVGVHDGVSRLADFGVAKSALAMHRTDQAYIVGKLCYLAPEYLRREPTGPSLDTYALGVTLWLALTGGELWPEASEAQVVHAVLEEGIPALDDSVDVAPEIAAFVARACNADPLARFPTARAMAEVLVEFERRCGWLASHAEVAAQVRDRLGTHLKQRREALVHLGHGARRSPLPRLASAFRSTTPDRRGQITRVAPTRPPPARVSLESGRRPLASIPRTPSAEREHAVPQAAAVSRREQPLAWLARRWTRRHTVALLTALAGAAALVAALASDDPEERRSSGDDARDAALPRVLAADQAPPEQHKQHPGIAAPDVEAPVVSPIPPEAPRQESNRVEPTGVATGAPPDAPRAARPPPRPPDEIRRKNPYR